MNLKNKIYNVALSNIEIKGLILSLDVAIGYLEGLKSGIEGAIFGFSEIDRKVTSLELIKIKLGRYLEEEG